MTEEVEVVTLRDEATKLRVIKLDANGLTQQSISELTGIPRSSIGDFLRKESYTSWWATYRPGESKTTAQPMQKAVHLISCPDYNKLITEFKYPIITRDYVEDNCKHLFIPDTQCKDGIDMSYLRWFGQYIVDKRPDVIIHIGDHADMPSLSSYDKGKRSAEGRRVVVDINAAIRGMEELLKPLHELQQWELEEFGEVRYKPRMVLTLGNHEERIQRHVDANPELHGFLGYDNLLYQDMGWEVYDYLQPVVVNGVTYCHFMANPMTGKPYGGMASNILKNVGESFSMGHKQCLDITTRFLPASGKQQWGIVAGASYPHDEGYKGYQGNHHWRGLILKHNVVEGSYNPLFVDLDYLKRRYD